jgi:biotin/lipoate A/B protein ligase family protein
MATPATTVRQRALDLPPAYALVSLREAGDAFAHACAIAGEAGAGTLVLVRRFDLVEFAVVLEPDEPLVSARRAFYCGMNAIGDAIAAHCAPEREVTFDWPGTIRFNGGLIGGARLGWPDGCAEDETPAWLVFAAVLRAAWVGGREPGAAPEATSLEEEGGLEDGDGSALVESFARYLMLAFDTLAERGFDAIAESYFARLPLRKAGERRGIDRNGDLLVRRFGAPEPERLALVPALREASWYDAKTGAPRL